MLCFHLSGTLATLVAKQPTIPCITCLAISPLLQVNALKAPRTNAFFQNYWQSHNWKGPYNVNMVVAIFLPLYMMSILLLFTVPIQEFSTFLLRKREITLRRPFSFHDAKKIAYVLFCDNCTTFKVCPYMRIFPLAQSVHLLLEHNETPYNNQSTESTERWHLRFNLTIELQYRY